MKIQKIETHTYAPELNKLHLKNGIVLPIPYTPNIRRYREENNCSRVWKLGCVIVIYRDGLEVHRIQGFSSYKGVKLVLSRLKRNYTGKGIEIKCSLRSRYFKN